MRKVKNNISVSDPAVMFARGLESLIADPLMNPSRLDEQESASMKRNANRQDPRGNLFSALLRQFARP